MNFLILHYFFMICISSRRIFGHSSKRSGNYDIDGFINQLLASQKFDELADKVADRAVQRIKDMEEGQVLEKIIEHKNNNERPHEYRDEREETYKEKERSGVPDHRSAETKLGKMNVEMENKNDENDSGQDLTLKYEYLKKQAQGKKLERPNSNPSWGNVDVSHERNKQRPTEEREYQQRSTPDSIEKRILSDHPSLNREKERGRYSQGQKEIGKDSLSQEHLERHNRYPSDQRERIQSGRSSQRGKPGAYRLNKNIKPQFKSILRSTEEREDTAIVIDPNTNGEISDNNKHEEVNRAKHFEEMENLNDDEEEQDEIVNPPNENIVWKDKKEYLKDIDTDSEEAAYKKLQKAEELANGVTEDPELTTSKKRIIRREGNKFYTYLSAPEYAEYHEELAKKKDDLAMS